MKQHFVSNWSPGGKGCKIEACFTEKKKILVILASLHFFFFFFRSVLFPALLQFLFFRTTFFTASLEKKNCRSFFQLHRVDTNLSWQAGAFWTWPHNLANLAKMDGKIFNDVRCFLGQDRAPIQCWLFGPKWKLQVVQLRLSCCTSFENWCDRLRRAPIPSCANFASFEVVFFVDQVV